MGWKPMKTALMAGTFRTVIIEAASGRKKPRYCEAEGCDKSTAERKPFCSEHVEQHGYVQEVMMALGQQEDELNRVRERGWREVDVNGEVCKEILQQLQLGARSYSRLKREVYHLTSDRLVEQYALALEKAGLATRSRNSRKKMMLAFNG